jgi:hypothetical protein
MQLQLRGVGLGHIAPRQYMYTVLAGYQYGVGCCGPIYSRTVDMESWWLELIVGSPQRGTTTGIKPGLK